MNAVLLAGCAVLASLLPLAAWAQAVPTRAWGDAAMGRRASWAIALASLALQAAAADIALGAAGAVALVVSAWMALGWLLVLGMNQWPAASRRVALALGLGGLAGCGLGIARALA
nr:hypothetical protein [Variovorax boronicumulans]